MEQTPKRSTLALVLFGLVVLAAGVATAQSRPPESSPGRAGVAPMARLATAPCEVATLQAFAPANTTIIKTEKLTSPTPYCRADGFVVSTNPGPNQINFMVSLPDDFSGRYYMINSGGNSGFVPNPPANLLTAGYAIAGTDTGNQDRFPIYTYLSDKAKSLDQAWRGTHLTAVSTQAITKAYYNVTKMFRYAVGCSGGGRLGLTVATNHPEDFDGVVSGAPGSGVSYPQQARIGQYGKLHPEAWISPAQLAQVDAAVTAKYDAADGAVDGIVWDPSIIKFDEHKVIKLKTVYIDVQCRWASMLNLISVSIGVNCVESWLVWSGAKLKPKLFGRAKLCDKTRIQVTTKRSSERRHRGNSILEHFRAMIIEFD